MALRSAIKAGVEGLAFDNLAGNSIAVLRRYVKAKLVRPPPAREAGLGERAERQEPVSAHRRLWPLPGIYAELLPASSYAAGGTRVACFASRHLRLHRKVQKQFASMYVAPCCDHRSQAALAPARARPPSSWAPAGGRRTTRLVAGGWIRRWACGG